MDYKLTSRDELSHRARSCGIAQWHALTEFVRNLPYGRNANRHDFGLVLSEKKGSCSSKHALLKVIADLNDIPGIELVLAIYGMTDHNTPGVGRVLRDHSLALLPEAHCYLKIGCERRDFTSSHSNFNRLEGDLIQELEIRPECVVDFKTAYHRAYLKKWLVAEGVERTLEEIWQIREQCIANMTD